MNKFYNTDYEEQETIVNIDYTRKKYHYIQAEKQYMKELLRK